MIDAGIYRIRCLISNNCYVGSSKTLARRFRDHRRALIRGNHQNWKLQRAWMKHGETNFEFEIIEIVEDYHLRRDREMYWIAKLNSYKRGYNLSPLGAGADDRTIEKIIAANKRRENVAAPLIAAARTPENRARMAELARRLNQSGVGGLKTEKAKASYRMKISQRTPEERALIGERISAAKRGRPNPKLSKVMREKHAAHPELTRRGWKHTPEALVKIKVANQARKKKTP